MRHFQIFDNRRKALLADNLTDNCKACKSKCDFEGKQIDDCPEYGGKRRQGYKITNLSSCFLCCDKTKTTKVFRQKMEALSYTVPELIIPINEIRAEEQIKVNRLVHNLTSINAHNIQEIYDLVPQDVLAQNWRNNLILLRQKFSKI